MSCSFPVPASPGVCAAAAAVAAAALALLAVPPVAAAAGSADEAEAYVAFVEDDSGRCADRGARLIQVKNTHPTRVLRVYLDRFHMGKGTGDRSRSELAPGAVEPLGCARTMDGPQEWRLVRAQFVE